MNRHEKGLVVDSLRGNFTKSKAAFLVSIQGLTVLQLQSLRREVRHNGGSMQIAKNTLLKRATEGIADSEILQPYFSHQLAIVFAHADVPKIAQILHTKTKDFEQLNFVAGCFEGTIVDKQQIVFLATLPSREQLLAMVCAGLNAPMSSLVSTLNSVMSQLAWTLEQVSEQKK